MVFHLPNLLTQPRQICCQNESSVVGRVPMGAQGDDEILGRPDVFRVSSEKLVALVSVFESCALCTNFGVSVQFSSRSCPIADASH